MGIFFKGIVIITILVSECKLCASVEVMPFVMCSLTSFLVNVRDVYVRCSVCRQY